MQDDRESVYVNNRDPSPEAEIEGDRQRQFVMANIKAALVTSRLTLSGHDAGVDPYNCRLGRRARSTWQLRRR